MTLQKEYPVTEICEVLDLPRSTFYHQSTAQDDTALRQALRELSGEYPTYGYRRLTALLERTRADILDEMERQGVSIDESKLTRVVLLKRSVLKRCVYGVDLNAMAVELAKVSLWLDAFTLGAPLSFLDHHLKWGNSLIGARIAEVQDYLAAREGETVDMFSGSKFAGVMLATDLMRQVSYLSDNTIEQNAPQRPGLPRRQRSPRPLQAGAGRVYLALVWQPHAQARENGHCAAALLNECS